MSIRLAAAALASCSGLAMAQGPDVTLQDIQDIANFGLVGGVYSYAIGSYTCNIGNLNLLWTSSGTPGLAMNAYRLHDGRLMQVGMSWVKTACCAAVGAGCGTCNNQGGSVLGAGCRDIYSASWNSGQSRLGPRSGINAYTGAFTSFPGTSGDAAFKRLQVPAADMNAATYPGALYFVEGVYAATDDAQFSNSHNNATYKRTTMSNGSLTVVAGSQQTTIPAIRAWRDHGLGVNQVDPSVQIGQVDVSGEGRFWTANKVRSLGNGWYRYEYAVFNLNSDLAAGGFSVPVPSNVTVQNIGFHMPLYHSGEIYVNAPWVGAVSSGAVRWNTPQTFAQNPNSSAVRWGVMSNFWFDANVAPTSGAATLSLFKPSTPSTVAVPGQVPGTPCYANCDGSTASPVLNVQDFSCFLNRFSSGDEYANCDGSTTDPIFNISDFACYLNAFAAGCS